MISLCGYAFWGTAFAVQWRDRRVSAFLTLLVMVALNALPLYVNASPYSFRKVAFLIHPAVLATSPLPAADAALGGDG